MLNKKWRIATRNSPLALWQANYIKDALIQHWPGLCIELVPMCTSGDRFLKDKLLAIGNKGLFVKELEEALLAHTADFAVHSMKDVPATFPTGLMLAAICARHSPWDAFISNKYANLAALPEQAVIGTSSLRRQAQLLAARPNLSIKALRGNIHTRLKKLAQGEFDAIILAVAGLERMNMQHLITETFNAQTMLPACGQGALGIECRQKDTTALALIAPLNSHDTALCIHTERAVNAAIGGNCHTPVAIYCALQNPHELLLSAKVFTADGQLTISNTQIGHRNDANVLAQKCAQFLLENGANDILGKNE